MQHSVHVDEVTFCIEAMNRSTFHTKVNFEGTVRTTTDSNSQLKLDVWYQIYMHL